MKAPYTETLPSSLHITTAKNAIGLTMNNGANEDQLNRGGSKGSGPHSKLWAL